MNMLYRKLRARGCEKELSILGFGCMRLPASAGCSVDEPAAVALIREAVDLGVNYFDTAYNYHGGQSEPVLGRALKGVRERVSVATKLPGWRIKSREEMDAILCEQLRRLQTGYVDFYLLHALNGAMWERLLSLGVRGFLDSAIRDGRIRYAGFSFHGDPASFKTIVDSYDWALCQIQYNYMDESYQAGTAGLRYASSKGLGVVVMEPLRGGLLSKEMPGLGRIWSRLGGGMTPSQWGLRWVWDHPEVTLALSGMNTVQQLRENAAAADEGFPSSFSGVELELFRRIRSFYLERVVVGCTGCRYCMPCPNGVDIPECFNLYNNAFVYDDLENSRRVYREYLAEQGGAGRCKGCRRCEDLCPQHIHIPAKLKEVAETIGR